MIEVKAQLSQNHRAVLRGVCVCVCMFRQVGVGCKLVSFAPLGPDVK